VISLIPYLGHEFIAAILKRESTAAIDLSADSESSTENSLPPEFSLTPGDKEKPVMYLGNKFPFLFRNKQELPVFYRCRGAASLPGCAIGEDEISNRGIRKVYEHEMCETTYALGHSSAEIQRLTNQAAMLRPITERLLRNAGIDAGMRVLDLGCGAGGVSMLAAELVGSAGSVVGIDRSQEVLNVAKARAREAGLRQISFVQSSIEAFSAREPFDLVIGRYILVHQTEPVSLLRNTARLVRSGGALAFQEIRLDDDTRSLPSVPLWDWTANLVRAALQSSVPNYYGADRLVEHFSEAGLPYPNLFCEKLVGGSADSPLYGSLAELLQILQPQLERMGIMTAESMAMEGLESRLRDAVIEARSQIYGPAQVCAWALL
jgi:ubiquinone/menaquinone biosynthesis C-methylase UbiE